MELGYKQPSVSVLFKCFCWASPHLASAPESFQKYVKTEFHLSPEPFAFECYHYTSDGMKQRILKGILTFHCDLIWESCRNKRVKLALCSSCTKPSITDSQLCPAHPLVCDTWSTPASCGDQLCVLGLVFVSSGGSCLSLVAS